MSKRSPARTNAPRSATPGKGTDVSHDRPETVSAPRTVSARWIGGALAVVVVAAALCVWGALCLTFWQGSWQILYHPKTAVMHTPAEAGLAFETTGFAATEAGVPQLNGWWITAGPTARYTALFLHSATGNMGDTVQTLAQLHAAGLSVFTFDYRGYGQSQFVHPSEAHWNQDAESALHYLMDTRHIPPVTIVLAGVGLGADLALEVARTNPDIAGVILDDPLEEPAKIIFNDPRALLVPAHWLVDDRWDLNASAAKLSIPSLWFCRTHGCASGSKDAETEAFKNVGSSKMMVWLTSPIHEQKDYGDALSRWLGDLASRR
jgi:pimeloyl-ACP methyl ester carboxylesterase